MFKYVSSKPAASPRDNTTSTNHNDNRINNNKNYNNNSNNNNNYKNHKTGDYADRKENIPFPTMDPSLFSADPVLLNDKQMADFIVNGYVNIFLYIIYSNFRFALFLLILLFIYWKYLYSCIV